MKSIERKDSGFTLIEVLIVVVIIGILAGGAVPSFLGYLNRLRAGADVSQAATLIDQAVSKATASGTPKQVSFRIQNGEFQVATHNPGLSVVNTCFSGATNFQTIVPLDDLGLQLDTTNTTFGVNGTHSVANCTTTQFRLHISEQGLLYDIGNLNYAIPGGASGAALPARITFQSAANPELKQCIVIDKLIPSPKVLEGDDCVL